jgi:hypothetical protein
MYQNPTGGDGPWDFTLHSEVNVMTEDKTYAYYELSERAKLRAQQELDRLTQDDDWWYEGTKDTVDEFMGHLCYNFEHNSVDVEHGIMKWEGSVVLREDRLAKLEENYGGDKVKEVLDAAKELASLYKLMPKNPDEYLTPESLRIKVYNGRYDLDSLTEDLPNSEYEKMDAFVEKCTDLINDITNLILSWYVAEYMYVCSDEYKIEMAESNDWRFTEEGEYVNH